MTIILRPETEEKLLETARREGHDASALADALLNEALEEKAREYEQTAAAIQEGLKAGVAGCEKTLAQYITEQRAKRSLPESWPAPASLAEITPGVVVASE